MRFRFLAFALSGVVVASSACAVDSTAPLPVAAPDGAALSKGHNDDARAGAVISQGPDGEVAIYTFTIDPRQSHLLTFGAHTLTLPANAVCDGGAQYGLTFWDAPCTPERSMVTFTAKVRGASKGLPRVEFTPDLRFSPQTDVMLSLHVKGKRWAQAASWRILYCATWGYSGCVDESLLDPSLTTYLDRPAHTVFRRIKHFSGYLVAE